MICIQIGKVRTFIMKSGPLLWHLENSTDMSISPGGEGAVSEIFYVIKVSLKGLSTLV